jgi:TonB family protein
VYTFAEQMPVFREQSPDSLAYYLQHHIHYPAVARRERLSGRVFVQFVVNTQGQVEDVRLVKSVHPALDAEALRVVAALPTWAACGRQGGQPVRVALTVPVVFQLQAAVGGTTPFAGPFYPFGPDSLRRFVAWSARHSSYQLYGRWFVRFELTPTGQPLWETARPVLSATDFKSTDPDVLNALRQVLRSMPRWRPALAGGSNSLVLPVTFGAAAPVTALAYADFMPVFSGVETSAAGLARLLGTLLPAATPKGTATLYLEISEAGHVGSVQLLQASRPALGTAVLQAGAQLPRALAPALLNGQPVRVFYVLEVVR